MPSFRRTGGNATYKNDFPTKHFYQRKEVSHGDVTHFSGVFEGVANGSKSYITNVDWIENDNSVMAVINLGKYEDVICISENFEPKQFDDITFKTNIGWIRRNTEDKKVIRGYIYGGGEIYTDSGVFSCQESLKSHICSVERNLFGDNFLIIGNNLPAELNGRWGNITFSDGSGLSHRIINIDENRVYVNNDIGFEYDNNDAIFTSFPSKQDAAGALWMNGVNYKLLTDRQINGDISYTVDYIYYGSPESTILITENGKEFDSLKKDSRYEIKSVSDRIANMYVAVYKGNKLYNIYTAGAGEEINIFFDDKFFMYSEINASSDVLVKCMLLDNNLAPLCDFKILR